MSGYMVENVEHNKCTGCSACYNACPTKAIRMEYDKEGFAFPQVSKDKCIQCGLCMETCPVEKDIEVIHHKDISPAYYAARGSRELIDKSSSGGLFSIIAEHIISLDGVVCGCSWNSDYTDAQHIVVDSLEGLEALRKSKYLQSSIGKSYSEVKKYLNEDRWVLFSGTPCQVAGLYTFLKKKYEKLVTIDIICHGVPSKAAYRSWLNEYAGNRQIDHVNFRDKSVAHWGTVEYIKFKDGSSYYDDCFHGMWYKAFLRGISTRECCGTCKYANLDRVGDFTLGDFWGINDYLPDFDDGYGTSLLAINTSKAEMIFDNVKDKLKIANVSQNDLVDIAKTRNGNLLHSTPCHWARNRFFELINHKKFSEAVAWTIDAKYDVGIVGWWYNLNYGGTLTYFALNKLLTQHGYSVLMINRKSNDPNYRPDINSIPYKFAMKHYYISKVHTSSGMYDLNNHCRAFISGSDQLFNPTLWQWSGPEYFLDFVDGRNRKIGVASSFGNAYVDNINITDKLNYWLHRFDGISVREDYAVDIAKDTFGLSVKKLLDPVFLCDKNVYLDEAKKSNATEKDFFVNFYLDPSEEKRQIIKYAHEILNKQYINLINADHIEENIKKMNMDNVKAYAEIEDWLYYYSNSNFIITDSFHGTCFAIIFHKPFISIANTQRGENRFISVLKELGLLNRLVYSFDEIKERKDELFSDIDYTEVDNILKQKKEESLEWLFNAIDGPRKMDEFKMLDSKMFDIERKLNSLLNK